jgi:hypothetical protein
MLQYTTAVFRSDSGGAKSAELNKAYLDIFHRSALPLIVFSASCIIGATHFLPALAIY